MPRYTDRATSVSKVARPARPARATRIIKTTENDRTILRGVDGIELEGVLYFIPEKYTATMELGTEHSTLFNIILANVIHYRVKMDNLDLTTITKTNMDKYVNVAERIFAFCITGKMDSGSIFQKWERDVINKIPSFIIPKINPIIVERLD
jgi:hypothetical protein